MPLGTAVSVVANGDPKNPNAGGHDSDNTVYGMELFFFSH